MSKVMSEDVPLLRSFVYGIWGLAVFGSVFRLEFLHSQYGESAGGAISSLFFYLMLSIGVAAVPIVLTDYLQRNADSKQTRDRILLHSLAGSFGLALYTRVGRLPIVDNAKKNAIKEVDGAASFSEIVPELPIAEVMGLVFIQLGVLIGVLFITRSGRIPVVFEVFFGLLLLALPLLAAFVIN